ncbi:MAG: DUF1015 domain-containing protein [Eubacteriales bacterium]
MSDLYFNRADILLPRDTHPSAMRKWSIVACDQYTSEPDYWAEVEAAVGNAPSTLRITYPELYLQAPDKEARIRAIGDAMHSYSETVLTTVPGTMVYVERTMKNGKIRHGIVGAFDLEAYSYEKGVPSPIRATEETVLSRIPPRIQIRKHAPLETPHVMILADDRENKLFSAAAEAKNNASPCYDFDLMQNGGHITGWLLHAEGCDCVERLAKALGDPSVFSARYRTDAAPLVFAVGDGNHSLATAKACYEALKAEIGTEQAMRHPARFTLAELVNLHDEALEFEPIYRVVFGTDSDSLIGAMRRMYPNMTVSAGGDVRSIPDADNAHVIIMTAAGKTQTLVIPNPTAQLPVGTLQSFLDGYLAEHKEAQIDYIHGIAATEKLSAGENAVGFVFRGMGKDDLFRTVIFDGALPRKTFSMGEADEKRYYLECRKIR